MRIADWIIKHRFVIAITTWLYVLGVVFPWIWFNTDFFQAALRLLQTPGFWLIMSPYLLVLCASWLFAILLVFNLRRKR